MCLMASANHLMTVFLAVEMASVPSYVLAGIIKGRRRAAKRRSSTPCTARVRRASCSTASACWPACWARPTCRRSPTRLAELDIPAMVDSGESWRHAHGAGPGGADDHGRPGVQALGRAVPLLVPGRVRRRVGRSRRVPVGRLEGRGAGAAGARGARRQHVPAERARRPRRRLPNAAVPAQTVALPATPTGDSRSSGRGRQRPTRRCPARARPHLHRPACSP